MFSRTPPPPLTPPLPLQEGVNNENDEKAEQEQIVANMVIIMFVGGVCFWCLLGSVIASYVRWRNKHTQYSLFTEEGVDLDEAPNAVEMADAVVSSSSTSDGGRGEEMRLEAPAGYGSPIHSFIRSTRELINNRGIHAALLYGQPLVVRDETDELTS